MDLRIYAAAEVRKGGSMSKARIFSVFPIPRKGGAKPIVGDDMDAIKDGGGEGGGARGIHVRPAGLERLSAVSKPDKVPAVSQMPEALRAPSASAASRASHTTALLFPGRLPRRPQPTGRSSLRP